MTSVSLPSTRLGELAASSLRIILASQQPSGAFPASLTFSAYRGYCWFRDGSFIADAASAAGEEEAASRFFDWCARILDDRRGQVQVIVAAAAAGASAPDEKMLATRFTFDGREGDDDWWDFQLDGYGTWAWALAEHCRRSGIDASRWSSALELTCDYLVSSWRRPCFDWWEEHSEEVHVSTLGCVVAGLDALSELGVLDDTRRTAAARAAAEARVLIYERGVQGGHLVKWLDSGDSDASLAALISPLGVLDPASDLTGATLDTIAIDLEVDGGVHRFRADTFYGGGQWPLLSCFLGLAELARGNRGRAQTLLEWAASTAGPAGELPEQVDRHLLAPDRHQEWVDRWGPVASPLLWSSAMYLRLALELGVVAPIERTGR
ncbi:glycoside hydrolase family 15 protein [Naasia aerilata]|uniref:GH15-like domain-containing protein n=1 Tax=Naasia aerilata TaxID=1162966 RepID=A0ABN6XNF2_9MICO|nr:glycoside hydrolase family 15 protein [Naasia aerilata]BDZ46519.1 hypothetical protein GCM10025866_24280 [Naasia aerilata]